MLQFSKKGMLLTSCILVLSCACFAQDIIITKDAKKISAKVLRIAEDNVRYKDFEDQNGLSHTILKKDVASILYENGDVESFDKVYTDNTDEQRSDSNVAVTEIAGKNMTPIGEKATVYVIRNSIVGSLIRMVVECNGMKIGSTKAKQYLYTLLDPGAYTFVSTTPENKASLDITLEAGKTYYIKQKVKMGIVVARTGLELMNEADAKKALNDCKLSSDNIYIPENNEYNEENQVSKPVTVSNQAPVQYKNSKSNEMFEILSINIPDSVVFKFTEGKTDIKNINSVSVFLVSNNETVSPEKIVVDPVTINVGKDGAFNAIYTDETIFCARNFKIFDPNIEVQKIKIVVNKKVTMYYDLKKSKWE